jgi:hypothetical protein
VLGRTRQARFPAESALATMRLSKLLTPSPVLDATFGPVADDTAPPASDDTAEPV